MVLMDELLVAIAAFDPARFARNLQPDARMAKPRPAAVAGDLPAVHHFGFRGLDCQAVSLPVVAGQAAV